MSIPQPTLDDRAYADLLDEARALIPSLAPQWTNHNSSDPGITLIELFAWLTEMLIYRVNRLPEANTRAFLRLLNGRQWRSGEDLDEDVRTTVLGLRQRHRAVTAEDYEALAQAVPGVARARSVPRRHLGEKSEAGRRAPREGYISLVVVPDRDAAEAGPPLPGPELVAAVERDLAPRRLLGVRQVVAPPVYVPIQAEIVVAHRPDMLDLERVRQGIVTALRGYLDALQGGPEGKGWPFGRDVYVSELYRLLEKVPGVDYVADLLLSSTCPEDAPYWAAGQELWHEEGDPIGIELAAHHLPAPSSIVIALGSAFLPVRLEVEATAEPPFPQPEVRRAARTALRKRFHPLQGGPGGDEPWTITASQIAEELEGLPEIREVARVVLLADPARLYQEGMETGVRFAAREMADVTVTVSV